MKFLEFFHCNVASFIGRIHADVIVYISAHLHFEFLNPRCTKSI